MKPFNIFNLLISFALLLTLASCEDVIDVNPEKGKKTLVVEGWLTNKPQNHYVKLYYTGALSDNSGFSHLTNAKLTLSDDENNQEVLQEVGPGKYEIVTTRAVEGKVYTLKIESSEGNYQAIAPVKRQSGKPDSLTFKYEEESVMYEKAGYYPLFHGQELEGVGDFMQIRLYKNGVYLNKKNDFNLSDDELVDGNYIGDTELAVNDPFQKNDVVKVEIWSLTEEAYLFWTDIRTQLQNGQLFATPFSNARTNVKKTSEGALDVVGYFGASLVQSIEKTVE
mgnify:CR=1 FL=1